MVALNLHNKCLPKGFADEELKTRRVIRGPKNLGWPEIQAIRRLPKDSNNNVNRIRGK